MNELKIFTSKEFGNIRTVENSSNPLFVGIDAAKMLGYAKPANAVATHCRSTLKRGIPHPQNPNKTINVLCIPFGDVLRLIASSKLPSSQRFESWIFDEVIPSIMRTGAYTIPQQSTPQPTLLSGLEQTLTVLKDMDSRINELTASQAAIVDKQTELEKSIKRSIPTDWMTTAKERVQNISGHSFRSSGLLLGDLYTDLERSENINISSRVSRQQARMKKNGATKREIETVTKLFTISLDEHLKIKFEDLLTVRELAKPSCPSPARLLED